MPNFNLPPIFETAIAILGRNVLNQSENPILRLSVVLRAEFFAEIILLIIFFIVINSKTT